jgi:hypothetical protein
VRADRWDSEIQSAREGGIRERKLVGRVGTEAVCPRDHTVSPEVHENRGDSDGLLGGERRMSKRIAWLGYGLLVALGWVTSGGAAAAELDGSAPILCAVMGATECDRWGLCDGIDGSSMGLPLFIRVNVGGKALEATDGSGRESVIHSSMLVKEPARLLLQGSEQGRAWSVVIDQNTGEMTAAVADHDGGFLIAGACTLP